MSDPTIVFDLTDANGNPLTEGGLRDHENATVTWQDSTAADLVTMQIPLDHDAAAEILNTETSGAPDRNVYVKAYRSPTGDAADRRLVFHGPVWVDQVLGRQRQLAIVACAPDIVLTKRPTITQYAPTDCGLLLKSMIDTTNSTDGETGIATDTTWITSSSTIDVDARQNRPTIQSLRAQFAQQLDGCESWIVPIEYAAGKIGRFYAAPSRGSMTTVVFAYGEGTQANVVNMTRARDTGKIVNEARGITDGGLSSTKTDTASVSAIGRLIEYVSLTGETSQSVLDARTQGLVDRLGSRDAVAEYAIDVDSGSPRLWDDFDIGDSVTLLFRDAGVEWEVVKRVRSATVSVDQTGTEIPTRVEVGA